MKQLSGQYALLTGASRGIGPYIARALAGRGVHLALAARSHDALDALAAELRATGVRALPVVADLADAASREALLARVAAELGPLDILVNNAGVFHAGELRQRSAEEVEGSVHLNLVVPIELTRRVLPAMLARRRGHVVQVASLAGKVPLPYGALYSATKYGLVGFNQALQAELHGTGVRASAVCPGFVAGEGMWARLGGRVHPALGISSPERVAGAVVDVLARGDVERVVNPLPVAPFVALCATAPRAAAAAARAIGLNAFMRDVLEGGERVRR